LPGLIGSASTKSGVLTLSVVNAHATLRAEAMIDLRGFSARRATVSELSHVELAAHNTFDEPHVLGPRTLEIEVDEHPWRHVFAPASVTVMQLVPANV
jgi:alpha-N-arabinofuranosidase